MKIWTITEIQSNICDVTTKAYTSYEKAIAAWDELKAEHDALYQEVMLEGLEETEDMVTEEYIRDPNNKHFSYDNGEYYVAIDLLIHEVE